MAETPISASGHVTEITVTFTKIWEAAVQACLNAHVDVHRRDAGKMTELEKIREDAAARAQVFDDTVANLVRAKMAHATADVTLRAMRDQIEALSAQVPLENGVGTNSPNWRARATAQASRLRLVAEPSVTAAVHKYVPIRGVQKFRNLPGNPVGGT